MISDALKQKINDSYDVLKLAAKMSKLYYQAPLILTYSGGKDSDVMVQLAMECLEPSDFEVLNSHTTVDAPETVYYIRDSFKEWREKGVKCTVQIPRYEDGSPKTMWNLIPKKEIPPTRINRYCCAELKEASTPNRFIAIGVREAESVGRKNRNVFATRGKTKYEAYYYYYYKIAESFESSERERERVGGKPNDYDVYDCKFIEKAKQKNELICNPIYAWTDTDVWEFIRDRKMKYNPLYDCGFKRVGCIGCPMSTHRMDELNRYPKIKENYKRALAKMLEVRKQKGKNDHDGKWKDADSIFAWWVQDEQIPGQLEFDLDGNIKEHKA